MENETRDFNKAAATYDEDPRREKLAGEVAASIIGNITITPDMDVMDFGCGTGLLTLNLQPLVHSIAGVDSSPGMLNMLRAKVQSRELNNVLTHCIDIDGGDVLEGTFHLITSSMTLHHIKAIEPLLDLFHKSLLPSGYLAIADLDLDDGQFHEDNTGVIHNGLDRAWLQRRFEDAGFEDVSHRTATSVRRPVAGGGSRDFSIFLMIGRKK